MFLKITEIPKKFIFFITNGKIALFEYAASILILQGKNIIQRGEILVSKEKKVARAGVLLNTKREEICCTFKQQTSAKGEKDKVQTPRKKVNSIHKDFNYDFWGFGF